MQPETTQPKRKWIVRLSALGGTLGLAALGFWALSPAAPPPAPPAPVVVVEAPPPAPQLKETSATVKRGDHLAGVVARADVTATEASQLVAALATVREPRKIRPGNTLTVWKDPSGQIAKAEFRSSLTDVIDLTPTESGFSATQREIKLETEVARGGRHRLVPLQRPYRADEDPSLASLSATCSPGRWTSTGTSRKATG